MVRSPGVDAPWIEFVLPALAQTALTVCLVVGFARWATIRRRAGYSDVCRVEEGASLTAFAWAIGGISGLWPTPVDLVLTESALYVESARFPHFVAYAVRFDEPCVVAELRVPGMQQTRSLLACSVEGERLLLRLHQPLGEVTLRLRVDDPDGWAAEIGRLLDAARSGRST